MSEVVTGLTNAFFLLASGDRELFGVIALSLRVSLTAALIGFALGAPFGAALAVRHFAGRDAVLVVLNALLGLPPVVVGLVVYLLLSRSGALGALGLLFTPAAMVLAQTILSAPIVAALAQRALEPLWLQYGESFRIAGATRAQAAFQLCRMAKGALLTAFLAAFGRAIAEVGAILIVGGNIRGFTRTMTTAIALETSKGDLGLALGLGLVLLLLSVGVSTLVLAVGWRTPRR